MSGKKFTFKKAAAPTAAPKKEKSTFAAFAAPEVPAFKSSGLSDTSIIELLIQQDVSVWIPLLIVAKDNERAKAKALDVYNLAFVNWTSGFFEGGAYSKDLEGIPIPALCRAISRITSNIVYSNDNGKAYFAFDGLGVLEDLHWKVYVTPKNLNVVPISSEQAVDAQIFAASVSIDSIQKSVPIDGVYQNVSIPSFKKKNCPEKDKIPLVIKQLFKPLLKGVNWDKYTIDDIKDAPWIWEYVYEAVKDVKIPATGIPLELAFFGFVKQTYEYCPMDLKISDVLYTNYPRINKDIIAQLNQHSFMVGGKAVQAGHYFNFGVYHLKKKTIGGFVPAEYCRYNTHQGVTWERTGSFVESTLLETKVTGPRDIQDFDGVWYDPCPVETIHLAKACGLIVPYDKNGNGLAKVEDWMEKCKKSPKHLSLWATYGPSPLLWVMEDHTAPKGYSHVAASVLWRCMPTMNLYNFTASLNRNSALANAAGELDKFELECEEFKYNDVPVDPVASIFYSGRPTRVVVAEKEKDVPEFEITCFPRDFLPGRHLDKRKKENVTDEALEDYDLYRDFAKDMADEVPEDYANFGNMPAAKKRRTGAAAPPEEERRKMDED